MVSSSGTSSKVKKKESTESSKDKINRTTSASSMKSDRALPLAKQNSRIGAKDELPTINELNEKDNNIKSYGSSSPNTQQSSQFEQ